MVYRISQEEDKTPDYGASSGDNNTDPNKEKVIDELDGQPELENNVTVDADALNQDLKQARDSIDDLDDIKKDVELTEELSEEAFHNYRDKLALIRMQNGFGAKAFSVESMPTDRKIALLAGLDDTKSSLEHAIEKAEAYLLKTHP